MIFSLVWFPVLEQSQHSAGFIHGTQAFLGLFTTTQLCKQLPAPSEKHNHQKKTSDYVYASTVALDAIIYVFNTEKHHAKGVCHTPEMSGLQLGHKLS